MSNYTLTLLKYGTNPGRHILFLNNDDVPVTCPRIKSCEEMLKICNSPKRIFVKRELRCWEICPNVCEAAEKVKQQIISKEKEGGTHIFPKNM